MFMIMIFLFISVEHTAYFSRKWIWQLVKICVKSHPDLPTNIFCFVLGLSNMTLLIDELKADHVPESFQSFPLIGDAVPTVTIQRAQSDKVFLAPWEF